MIGGWDNVFLKIIHLTQPFCLLNMKLTLNKAVAVHDFFSQLNTRISHNNYLVNVDSIAHLNRQHEIVEKTTHPSNRKVDLLPPYRESTAIRSQPLKRPLLWNFLTLSVNAFSNPHSEYNAVLSHEKNRPIKRSIYRTVILLLTFFKSDD